MSDLISRQEAINAATYGNPQTAWERIKNLPSAQEWIPVSERLPEETGYYLTSTEYHDVLSDFFCDGKWSTAELYWYNVKAWMPLPEPFPEPYKGGE